MSQKIKLYLLSLISCLLLPALSFAAPLQGINDIFVAVGGLIKLASPMAFALCLLYFFYGIATYILRAGDEKKAKEGKSIMVYGTIAMFVVVSIFGIIRFIGEQLGIDTGVQNSSTVSSSMGGVDSSLLQNQP